MCLFVIISGLLGIIFVLTFKIFFAVFALIFGILGLGALFGCGDYS